MSEILLTGGSGQVGTALRQLSWPDGVALVAPGRAALDLADPAALAAAVHSRPWALVINCAAYTAVDKAESDVVPAWTANALAPAALAAATAQKNIPILQVSTDYVFDGAKATPYVETDPVGPLGVYGASKEGGEQAVRTANPRHLILRTAWVVSATGSNFVKTMLRLGADRPLLRVVADQHGCPSSAADVAAAIATIAALQINDANCPRGTYHFTNADETTWHGFAQEIFRQAAARGGPSPQLVAIATAQFPTPARRPANSRLSSAKIARDFGIAPQPWQAALGQILAQLL